MINLQIKLSEWTNAPGGRTKKDSAYSAEWFFKDVIEDLFYKIKALPLSHDIKFLLNFDDLYGAPPSFLDQLIYYLNNIVKECFGSKAAVKDHFDFVCTEDADNGTLKMIDNAIIDYSVLFKEQKEHEQIS